jgi:hypothetical protein
VRSSARRRRDREHSAQPADHSLWEGIARRARCAQSALHPDEWFPVSEQAEIARREATAAIATCMACPVRVQCLELSLRHWDIGQHGIWGGLLPAERAALRRRWPAREGSGSRRRRSPGPGGPGHTTGQ